MRHPEPSTRMLSSLIMFRTRGEGSAPLLFSATVPSSSPGQPYGAAGPNLRLRGNRVKTLFCSRGLPQDGASRGRWMVNREGVAMDTTTQEHGKVWFSCVIAAACATPFASLRGEVFI